MMRAEKIVACLLISWAAFIAESGFAAGTKLSSGKLEQSALVFSRSAMPEMMASSAIRITALPAIVYSSQIQLACMSVPAWEDELLAYLPESSSCVPVNRLLNSTQQNFEFHSGRDARKYDRQKMLAKLQTNKYLVIRVIAPAASFSVLQSADNVAGVCSCPGNIAPTVNLISGGAQQVTINSVIADIVFSATDPDSDMLMGFFSYDLNGGASIEGLPAGLSSSCIEGEGLGTLSCTVSGTAPGIEGSYSIKLDVYDGFNTTSKSVNLTAIEPLPETIYENSFEAIP